MEVELGRIPSCFVLQNMQPTVLLRAILFLQYNILVMQYILYHIIE